MGGRPTPPCPRIHRRRGLGHQKSPIKVVQYFQVGHTVGSREYFVFYSVPKSATPDSYYALVHCPNLKSGSWKVAVLPVIGFLSSVYTTAVAAPLGLGLGLGPTKGQAGCLPWANSLRG